MLLCGFGELCSIDFQLKFLAASQTVKNPYRHYLCLKGQERLDRFFYIRKGFFCIQQEGCDEIIAKEGALLYLPGDCVYEAEWKSEEIEYFSVRFQLGSDEDCFSFSENITLQLYDENGRIKDILGDIVSFFSADKMGYKIKAYSLFFELLHFIATKSYEWDIKYSQKDISKAILYLENNYLAEELSVSALAKACGMCESKFRSRFHEYAGMPPISYRNFLRVKKAAELLQSGEYNVGEVAELTGFWDNAYFNRVFRRFMGHNPRDYKK